MAKKIKIEYCDKCGWIKQQCTCEKEIDQKQVILDCLETAYVGARMMDDEEIMCRLNRAIIAFGYDNLDEELDWNEAKYEYLLKMTSIK